MMRYVDATKNNLLGPAFGFFLVLGLLSHDQFEVVQCNITDILAFPINNRGHEYKECIIGHIWTPFSINGGSLYKLYIYIYIQYYQRVPQSLNKFDIYIPPSRQGRPPTFS